MRLIDRSSPLKAGIASDPPEMLPADGPRIATVPVKVHRGSAGRARAVAIRPE